MALSPVCRRSRENVSCETLRLDKGAAENVANMTHGEAKSKIGCGFMADGFAHSQDHGRGVGVGLCAICIDARQSHASQHSYATAAAMALALRPIELGCYASIGQHSQWLSAYGIGQSGTLSGTPGGTQGHGPSSHID